VARIRKTESAQRRGRLPAQDRLQRERELLDAAESVIVEKGYHHATMRDLADRAGASKETLYSWFGGREGLVAAVIAANADASAARLLAALEADVTDASGASEALTAYAAALLSLLTSDTSVALNRAAMSSPELAKILLASGRHRVGPIVEEYLGRLHSAGIIDAPDPSEAFRTLYGLVVRDTQILVLLGGSAPTRTHATAHAKVAVDQFMTLFGTGDR
jgi:AcrR family transcriptional regulator